MSVANSLRPEIYAVGGNAPWDDERFYEQERRRCQEMPPPSAAELPETVLLLTAKSGNSASVGAGVLNFFSGMLTIGNCTLAGNSATYQGGGRRRERRLHSRVLVFDTRRYFL